MRSCLHRKRSEEPRIICLSALGDVDSRHLRTYDSINLGDIDQLARYMYPFHVLNQGFVVSSCQWKSPRCLPRPSLQTVISHLFNCSSMISTWVPNNNIKETYFETHVHVVSQDRRCQPINASQPLIRKERSSKQAFKAASADGLENMPPTFAATHWCPCSDGH
jgi:hypothetical protein